MDHWIDIPNRPKYQLSIDGKVRNKHTGRILKTSTDKHGYAKLSLGNEDNVYVHRLAAETFYGTPEDKNATVVNHIDCNRQNNHILNLEWCTPSENLKWGIHKGNVIPSIGLSKASEVNKKAVRIVELDKIFRCVKDCAEYLGVPPTNVSRCLTGVRKGQKLHGYHIEYV